MNVYEIITERLLVKLEEGMRGLRGDSRMLVQAAAHAQKAADSILGRTAASPNDMAKDEHGAAARTALA
jgi:antirestriction protein ArdC